jgi:hypothetical protein
MSKAGAVRFSEWTPEKAAAISAKNRATHSKDRTPQSGLSLAAAAPGAQLAAGEQSLAAQSRVSKYKNVKVSVDGEVVDSKKEAKRLAHLRLLGRGGFIQELARQVEFMLRVDDSHVCKYVADFTYVDAEGRRHVEDVKSAHTRTLDVYRLKKKLMKACLGIEVEEV